MNLNKRLLAAAFLVMHILGYSWGCPEVPDSCTTDLIRFYLFNRNFPNGQQLSVDGGNDGNDDNDDAPIFTDQQIKIIFHGYTGSMQNKNMIALREAYLKGEKYPDINIIQVDYAELAQESCYPTLLDSLNIIGYCTAEFIRNVLVLKGITINRLHPIGFSFGAHAAAVTAENIRHDIGTFERLSGADPALPGFFPPFSGYWHKLNRKHAKFVDVIHTNSGIRGVFSSNAHYDFYANDGIQQNGCDDILDTLCSHARALLYYIESINSEVGFYAVPCSWQGDHLNQCEFGPSSKAVLVGEPCTPPENESDQGSYYFPTNPKSPFAMGKPKD